MRKTLSIFLALILTFACFTLSGCSDKNNVADNSDTKSDTYIEDDNTAENSETEAENTENTVSDNNKVEKDADGLYVYKLCNDSVEIHINTNVWDYIDADNVWDATRMAADLGFTNPIYYDKQINGFESENKIYEIIIYNKYELYKADSFDYALNSYDLFPAYSFGITGGSEWGSSDSTLTNFGVNIYDNQFREKSQYGIKGSNAHSTGYKVGVTFETIVFTAAGMEECNGMIPDTTIGDCLAIYLFDPGYYLLP